MKKVYLLNIEAKEYAQQGVPVFPLLPKSKQPATPRGFKDASADPQQAEAWWGRYPNANIGMPTGEASGFYVIDIDGPEGEASLAKLIAEHGEIPPTRTSKTGRGTHYLFKSSEPIKNTAGALGKGIDTRGEGGYIVLPPSLHPDGHRYEWISEREPAELPDWLKPKKREAAPLPAPTRPAVHAATDDRLTRASAYLAAMPPAIQGAAGHDALFSAACAMVNGFELSAGEAYNLLASEYNPRCAPAWDLSNASDLKDFRRKVDQAISTPHSNPRGYLLDDGGSAGDIEHGHAIAANLIANATRPAPQAATAPQKAAEPTLPESVPERLLKPPGMIGELAAWMDRTAWMSQPALSLAASIAFAGTLLGRKVETESRLRTNIYALGLADSGTGKEHARQCIKNLAILADAQTLLGGESVTSDAAIAGALHNSPRCLFLFDEIGHFIAGSKSRNASTHQAAIPVMFTKLYSTANSAYLGTDYAPGSEKERVPLVHPHACIYGTTVPRTLWENLTSSEIDDGMLGRFLVFSTPNKKPPVPRNSWDDPPAKLIEWVKSWNSYAPGPGGNLAEHSKDDADAIPQTDIYTLDAGAQAVLDQFTAHADARETEIGRGDTGNESLKTLWTRAEENARKLALIYAATQSAAPYNAATNITREAVTWACDLVTYLVERLILTLSTSIADSKAQADRNYVLQAIEKAGGKATLTQIARRTQRMDSKTRNPVLADLTTMDYIRPGVEQLNGSAKPTTYYELCT